MGYRYHIPKDLDWSKPFSFTSTTKKTYGPLGFLIAKKTTRIWKYTSSERR